MESTRLFQIIKDAAFEVRKHLYAGYLESVYQNALAVELKKRGLSVSKEIDIPVYYKDEIIGNFRADLVVENSIILEIKAVKELNIIHEAQLVNYLTATGLDYGFLINYGGAKYRIIFKTRIYSPPKT
ncbi:MAG: GxxExxY protein [Muribaculaceae bacterium]|nr:GxxExxY protein [Muribaculaceae bacterium]